jgi:hypothetical protein
MQSEILQAFRSSRQNKAETREQAAGETGPEPRQEILSANSANKFVTGDRWTSAISPSPDVALCYLRLANLDNELIDRLSRYEGGLWRETVQTLFALRALKRRYPS